jgi:hypothetical protein
MIGSYKAWSLWGALLSASLLHAETLPAPLREVQPELRPSGATTLRWFGIKIYDVALFAQEIPYTSNGTAVLSIRYDISIKHHRLLETTLQEWQRLGQGTETQRTQWIKQLDKLWPDLKPGDRLTAFKRRDGPTQFYFDDRLLGEISDPAFGPAFFAIWLDPNCRYPAVRKALLGEKRK